MIKITVGIHPPLATGTLSADPVPVGEEAAVEATPVPAKPADEPKDETHPPEDAPAPKKKQ